MEASRFSDELWLKCNSCNEIIYRKVVERNFQVCPKCNYHFQFPARRRIECLVDPDTFIEYDSDLTSSDPLEFKDSKKYSHRVKESEKNTGQKDAVICGVARIEGQPVMIGIFEFNFMGGSMGSVVGEKFVRAGRRALDGRMPFIFISASGGARMQEAALSLMQMAKTSAESGSLARAMGGARLVRLREAEKLSAELIQDFVS